MLCPREAWCLPGAAASLPISWLRQRRMGAGGSWPARALACGSPTMRRTCYHPAGPTWKCFSSSVNGLWTVSSWLTQGYLPTAGSRWGRLFFILTPPYRGPDMLFTRQISNIPWRKGSGTKRVRDWTKIRGTDSRSEQFLTLSSVLSQPALLQGSHGLTWGGAPKAGSRWKLELLKSQAGRCQSAASGTCSILQHLGGRTSEQTSVPHVRQAPKCSLPPWLWRWLLGSGRLALNEVKPQGQSWHPSKVGLCPHHNSEHGSTAELLQEQTSTSV